MTASRFEPAARPFDVSMTPRRTLLLASLVGALLAACRAGLPPEPPGADPADANATTPPYQVQANPYETSAFATEEPSTATGHEHMNHGAMNHGAMPGHANMGHGSAGASGQAPPPANPTGHENMDHGTMADKPAADAKPAPRPATPMNHENMDHGTKPAQPAKPPQPAKPVKPPADTDAMPHNMPMPSEPPR